MTYQDEFTLPQTLLETIADQSFDALPEAIRLLINAAMLLEPLTAGYHAEGLRAYKQSSTATTYFLYEGVSFMFYADLTAYEYLVNMHDGSPNEQYNDKFSPDILNVGWLEGGHDYRTCQASEEFLDALFELCRQPVNRMRGFHACSLCIPSELEVPDFWPSSEMTLNNNGNSIKLKLPKMLPITRNGITIKLGTGEIRVRGEKGFIYAAPTLIYHYVQYHNYCPPQQFIAAVMKVSKAFQPISR